MSAKLDVWNLTLSRINGGVVGNPDEDSVPANALRAVWEATVDAALEAHDWNFAGRIAELSRSATVPFGFSYQYVLPQDFIRLLRLSDDPGVLWDQALQDWLTWQIGHDSVDGRVIWTDLETVYIRYIARVTQVGLWPPAFCEFVSHMLEERVAIPLTGSNTLRATAIEERNRAGLMAAGVDGAQGPVRQRGVGPWVTSRPM